METPPGRQVCVSLFIDSSCWTLSETNKTRLQKCYFWISVLNHLPVQPVIPSLAAVHLWTHANIQQTSSTNLSLHSPYGFPEGDTLPHSFHLFKGHRKNSCSVSPSPHPTLLVGIFLFIYGLCQYKELANSFFFFFLLTLNKLRVSYI